MLAISLYPDKTTLEEDIAYLELARGLGYRHVFTSFLQIDPQNPARSVARIKESCRAAAERGFGITLDIHPLVFKVLDCPPTELSYFNDMGVTRLRVDSNFDGKTEAAMTRNPYGIGIEFNMSNNNPMLDLAESYGADTTRLSGSCNFYPQRYTGMTLQAFLAVAERYRAHHLRSGVFITSQRAEVSCWPICEGNCTLEMHRDLPIHLQARHLKMLNAVDDWIVGNVFAPADELAAVADEYRRERPLINVVMDPEASELERTLVCGERQRYRGDTSPYMIRSCDGRRSHARQSLPAHLNAPVRRGDVLVLNEDYGQYKGEVQIALMDRPASPRVNVVGRVVSDQLILMDALAPYGEFDLTEEKGE